MSIALFAISAALWLIVLVAGRVVPGAATGALAVMAHVLLTAAAFLLLAGVAARPLHKRLYHAALEPNDLWRGLHARNRAARLWLWLDAEGQDRDG